jgi:Uncharacterized protein conserved in bacteria
VSHTPPSTAEPRCVGGGGRDRTARRQSSDTKALAQKIIDVQRAEITEMQNLLTTI